VQELLLKVEQIDGKDSRELVKKDIKDAGEDYSKLRVLVRELTTSFAPELMDRWKDILRKIDEAAQVLQPAQPPLASMGAGTGSSSTPPTPQPTPGAWCGEFRRSATALATCQTRPTDCPTLLCRQTRPTAQLQDRRQ
jgi:hypothetical protein